MGTSLLERELKRGSTEVLILALLDERQRHGYEISQLIDERSNGTITFHTASLEFAMPDWKQRLQRAFEANGHAYDADVLEELCTHAAAEYDAHRARGSDASEAERYVDDLIEIWVRDAAE